MYKINVKEEYNIIESDIIKNQKDIFKLYNYYTKKYRGNILVDRNVGLFLGDNNIPTVQIFVRQKNEYIKTHILFNKAGDTVIDTKILNTTF